MLSFRAWNLYRSGLIFGIFGDLTTGFASDILRILLEYYPKVSMGRLSFFWPGRWGGGDDRGDKR